LSSAAPENLPIAEKIATEVLCLPLYGTLANDAVERIAGIVKALQEAA